MWNNYFTPSRVLVGVNDFFLVLMTLCIYYVRIYTLNVLTATVDILIFSLKKVQNEIIILLTQILTILTLISFLIDRKPNLSIRTRINILKLIVINKVMY